MVDAGLLDTTANRDLGPVNAVNLREAHRLLESGTTTVGKITLTGF
ncbi:hypothetical protein NGM37_35050 [Streptomyces sp. TRM76130]|nr:hypothetical protein [Streptomyces sp. TRM76130]